jgi:phosphoglycerate dehydrogenase-like enzyme
MSKTKLALCYPIQPYHLEAIRQAAGADIELINAGQEGIAEALFEADLYCGHAKVPVDWDAIVGQGRLRWIQSSAAGMDHCLVPSVIDSDIIVTSASGVLSNQVAEHTLGLIIAFCRSLPTFFDQQRAHQFVRRPTRDLTHQSVGIVGLGGVGRRLSELLAPFDTTVRAIDLFPIDQPETVQSLWTPDRLDELIELSTILILCAPLNETTVGMIGAEQLARMPKDGLLVNAARGPLVDTDALIDAISNQSIAGAVMDVTDPEPLPEDNRLWDMPQVIITPHVAGQYARRIDTMTRLLCENLRRWKTDQPLINQLEQKSLGFPIRGGKYPLWCDLENSVPMLPTS